MRSPVRSAGIGGPRTMPDAPDRVQWGECPIARASVGRRGPDQRATLEGQMSRNAQ